MDQRYILSFYVNEQLKMVLQNNGEITDSPPAFAGASCERDSTRQNDLITLVDFGRQLINLNKINKF